MLNQLRRVPSVIDPSVCPLGPALADNRQSQSSWHTSGASAWSSLIVHILNRLTELSRMPVTQLHLHHTRRTIKTSILPMQIYQTCSVNAFIMFNFYKIKSVMSSIQLTVLRLKPFAGPLAILIALGAMCSSYPHHRWHVTLSYTNRGVCVGFIFLKWCPEHVSEH